jgi:hypothetical protein
MNRRAFNKLVTTGVVGLGTAPGNTLQAQQSTPSSGAAEPSKWPSQVYRRLLVDTHIPDWDPRLLSRFDPVDYVGTIARAGFQCLMQYAISCAGLCMWRTKIGTLHRGMRGRDYFGEVMDECKRQGLYRVAYFHVIWDNHAFETHPDWRFQPSGGEDSILQGRYGYTCPNTPYRDYVLALTKELVSNYEFEGIFNDMIIWPGVCYCPYCTARFREEHNAEPPRIVDWNDPLWRTFQAARERWLYEFANDFTKTVKSIRAINVEHQFATVFSSWKAGVPLVMGTETMDSVGGDFYGGVGQFSLACKAFNSLNRVRPFEFMTSRTDDLEDFVTIKPVDQLRTESFLPSIYSGALLTIDAFNPEGTINHKVYEILGEINRERAPYEPFLGGKLLGDVAVYYDKESMYNPDEIGVHVEKLHAVNEMPHFKGVSGVARILREAHIPFGLITNATLDQLQDYRAVILPNVLELTAEQASQFRAFVKQGGVLYASGASSLDRFGKDGPHYLLEDVLGVRYKAPKLGTKVTYLTPKDEELKKIIWPQGEVIHRGTMVQADVLPGAEVWATITLPWVDPQTIHVIGSHFAQIISDPPAPTPGTDPGIVVNSFGRGKAIWVAGPIESSDHQVNARLIVSLLRRVLPGPYKFEADMHPSVEMTLFHQPEKQRLLAGLLNMQVEIPSIPVPAVVRVRVPSGQRATAVVRVPDRKPIPFQNVGPYVQFRLEPFPVIAMALVEYR